MAGTMFADVAPAELAQEAIQRLDAWFPKTQKQGGNYRATQNADGTWNVHEIPFFASHEMTKDEGGGTIDIDWQLDSLRTYQARVALDTYQPPLIINHHDKLGITRPMFVGHFALRRVGKTTLEGAEIDSTFVDLMFLDEWAYGAIRTGQLPYLSSEFSFKDKEHVHLSLLSDEAPWFKYPLITIGEEVPFTEDKTDGGIPAIRTGARLAARRHVIAYRKAQENDMADDKIDELQKTLKRQEKEMEATKAAIKKRQDDDADKKKKDDDEAKRTSDDAAAAKKKKDKDENKPAEQRGDKTGTPAGGEEELTEEEALKRSPALAARMAGLEGKVEGLALRSQVVDEKSDRQETIEKIVKSVGVTSFPNLAERVGKQYDLAGGGDHGAKAAQAFADGIRSTGVNAPPANWDGGVQPVTSEDHDDLAVFAGDVQALNTARGARANYDMLKSADIGFTVGWEGYLRSNHPDLAKRFLKKEEPAAK